jgi:hypothetical protein
MRLYGALIYLSYKYTPKSFIRVSPELYLFFIVQLGINVARTNQPIHGKRLLYVATYAFAPSLNDLESQGRQ